MKNHVLLYPIFLQCIPYCHDPYWDFLFEDMAYGKPPFGTFLNQNYLYCNHKGKEFSYRIDPQKNAEEVYKDVYSILNNKIGMRSELEKRKDQDNMMIDLTRKNKKRVIRDSMIEKFLLKQKIKHRYTNNLIRKIFSIIIIGLLFKTITIHDIIYKNEDIISIKGFSFMKNQKVIITKNLYQCYSYAKEYPITKRYLSDTWNEVFFYRYRPRLVG